ncbi:hypothetical protein [Vibrio splendidus]|uniref:hypothetical protein n=1 Tax=Vibrio splendidus TaxID=29497 RepID=UPI000808FFE5|nr:hypothetical protein [Vibrio splendidus]SBS66541.1 hypothetical protein VHE8714_03339 [Vibrio splendidus]
MFSQYEFEKEELPEVVVRSYITKCAQELDRESFRSETAYVNAFLGKLCTRIRLQSINKELFINFKTPIYDDRGPNSAESKFGADFGIIYTGDGIEKAILSQAKNMPVENLNNSQKEELRKQCRKMDQHTEDWMVFEAPVVTGAMPTVKFNLHGRSYTKPFDEYLIDNIVGCSHGDRRKEFVDAVQSSKLTKLELVFKDLHFI